MHRDELKTIVLGCFFFLVLSGCGTSHNATKSANQPNKEYADAIAEIQRLSGKVTFDEEAAGKPVYAVTFSETGIGDEALKPVGALTELKVLLLGYTQVTDAGLKHIEELTQIRRLWLDHTRVTDAGLEHIKTLVHLTDLMLDNTQVTDAGLKQIGGLVELKNLGLDHTQITNDGVKQLTTC